jgi:hypothetical protein
LIFEQIDPENYFFLTFQTTKSQTQNQLRFARLRQTRTPGELLRMRIQAKSFVLLLIVGVPCLPALAQRRNSSQRSAVTPTCYHKEEDEKNLICPAGEEKRETKTQTSAEQATIVNSKDKKGCTPLMRAAEHGDLQAFIVGRVDFDFTSRDTFVARYISAHACRQRRTTRNRQSATCGWC